MLSLAMGSLYLIPVSTYLPELEKIASKQLQTPVKIQSLSLAALPYPHLALHQVRLGGAEGIYAENIAVSFDLKALLAGKKEVRDIRASLVTVHYAELRKLMTQLGKTSGKPAVTLREFQADEVTLILPALTLHDAATRVTFAADGKLAKIWVSLDKEHLSATLLPQAQRHFALQVEAKDWATPLFPRLVWDKLHLDGVISETDFVATQLTAAMGDMQIAASARAAFAQNLQLTVQLDQLDAPIAPLLKLFQQSMPATGTLHIAGKLQGSANTLAELAQRVQFVGEVSGKQLQIVTIEQTGVLLDEWHAHLVADEKNVALSDLAAVLYGGKLTGLAKWSGQDQTVQTEIVLDDIEMQPLVAALTNRVLLSGKLAGKGNVAMQLNNKFPENILAAGNFHLQKGRLSQVDLIKAARAAKVKNEKNQVDSTEFDDFTGEVSVAGGSYRFSKLDLSSGVLRAQGNMTILPDKHLKGALDADLKGTLGLVSVPLVIAGTVELPVVHPSGAFLAGAALGTALLPGVGTVIGMKIGGLFNKIFSKSDEDTQVMSAVPSQQ